MITNLWLLNLYLAAQIMVIIAFAGLTWLYLDLYRQRRGQTEILLNALGAMFIAFGFSLSLALRVAEIDSYYLYRIIPFTLGMMMIAVGNYIEKVPGIPQVDQREDGDKKEVKKANIPYKNYYPKLLLILGLIPFIPTQGLAISLQYSHKIKFGLSKQFQSLFWGWLAFTLFLSIYLASIIGENSLVWLDVMTRDFAILWIVGQVSLIVSAFFILRWISLFLSFRIFSKLFFSIWQWAMYLSIICAGSFSLFMIKSTEEQIKDLLNKNVNLVNFTLDQIKSNNIDLLNVLSSDDNVVDLISTKNKEGLHEDLGVFLKNNENLDQVIVVDKTGLLIYDSDRPQAQGESFTSNNLVKKALLQETASHGFVVEKALAGADGLEYQFASPVKNKSNEVLGVIINIKRLDDNFLDLLKKQTDQQFIVYVGEKRSASTILEDDELSRLENLPFYEFDMTSESENSKAKFGKMVILTKPYYVGLLEFKDQSDVKVANMIVGTEQSILVKSTQRAIYNTFMLSLIISALATIPSYYLAKSIKKNFSV